MFRTYRSMVLVCLVIIMALMATTAGAWDYRPATFAEKQEDLASPAHNEALKPTTITKATSKTITKVTPKRIVKCKPLAMPQVCMDFPAPPTCILPRTNTRGWQLDAQAMWARTRGKIRNYHGAYNFAYWGSQGQIYPDVDMTGVLGLPEHQVVGTYSALFRFKPSWALRYSLTPMMQEGQVNGTNGVVFGTWTSLGLNSRTKWERMYHRVGLVFDTVRTASSRVGVFGDYVRVDDKMRVYQPGCCGETTNSEMNMAMAGIEFERCLRTTNKLNTMSLECKAGVAFLDNGIGADLSSAIKCSIPLNNGRWGYVSGGYRYVSLAKKYSEARLIDTTMDGGFVEMGVIF